MPSPPPPRLDTATKVCKSAPGQMSCIEHHRKTTGKRLAKTQSYDRWTIQRRTRNLERVMSSQHGIPTERRRVRLEELVSEKERLKTSDNFYKERRDRCKLSEGMERLVPNVSKVREIDVKF